MNQHGVETQLPASTATTTTATMTSTPKVLPSSLISIARDNSSPSLSDRPKPPPGMEALSIDEIDDLLWSQRPTKTQRARRNRRLRKQQRDRDLEAIANAYRDDHDDNPPPPLPLGPLPPPPGSLTRALRRSTTYERAPSPNTPRTQIQLRRQDFALQPKCN